MSAAPRRGRSPIALLAVLAACPAVPAYADPNDYVITLDFEEGEREIEAKLGAASSGHGVPAAQAAALSWGTSPTSYWLTEVYGQVAHPIPGMTGGGFDSVSWENVVRLAEPGAWPVDVGAVLEVEPGRRAAQGWSVTLGPVFQGDVDRVQLNGNLLFQQQFGGAVPTALQLGYQFQVKYRSDPHLEWGAQGFGSFGDWNHWGAPQAQAHNLGPAIFGRYRLGGGRAFVYNTAFLFGTGGSAASRTLRAQIELEY